MIKGKAILAGMVMCACAGSALALERRSLPLDWNTLIKISQESVLPHEALPQGVPPDYDWAQYPRMGAGNDPGGFKALTGWGQVFAVEESSNALPSVSIRDMHVLLCHGAQRDWLLVQQGPIEGSQFRADYKDNLNKPPLFTSYTSGVTSVRFEKGYAYHFWPKQGRVALPSNNICGIVVLLQARISVSPGRNGMPAEEAGGVLLGLGADYWKNKSAPWDNYQSNRDVAIGRLKRVNSIWSWFGMSTASIEDLRRLHMFGFKVQSP